MAAAARAQHPGHPGYVVGGPSARKPGRSEAGAAGRGDPCVGRNWKRRGVAGGGRPGPLDRCQQVIHMHHQGADLTQHRILVKHGRPLGRLQQLPPDRFQRVGIGLLLVRQPARVGHAGRRREQLHPAGRAKQARRGLGGRIAAIKHHVRQIGRIGRQRPERCAAQMHHALPGLERIDGVVVGVRKQAQAPLQARQIRCCRVDRRLRFKQQTDIPYGRGGVRARLAQQDGVPLALGAFGAGGYRCRHQHRRHHAVGQRPAFGLVQSLGQGGQCLCGQGFYGRASTLCGAALGRRGLAAGARAVAVP
ncbi:hypothetical protein G6F22_015683 [Rhizopus arrhizus]|nr:hypothetical protein G6F22_015683 [Rhizopus arrhizus]